MEKSVPPLRGRSGSKSFACRSLCGDFVSSHKGSAVHGVYLGSDSYCVWHTRSEATIKEHKMGENKKDELLIDHNHDGVDRRGFLKCMAWAGTGALCVMQGGILKSYSLSKMPDLGGSNRVGELSFVQISDSHMGFNKAANPNVV